MGTRGGNTQPYRLWRVKLRSFDREGLAWAAGFADGEGSFSKSKRKLEKRARLSFTIGQLDRRALDTFQAVTGLGKIYGPYPPYGAVSLRLSSNTHYRYVVDGFEQVQAITALLWTWLGTVKREQAKSVLKEYSIHASHSV